MDGLLGLPTDQHLLTKENTIKVKSGDEHLSAHATLNPERDSP